jgi:SAM-dependent MidA family methyltransferase
MDAIAWELAWQDALYGANGFYRRTAGPAGHFATATHGAAGGILAEALVTLALQHGLTHVVDVGAGRGELLAHLHAAQPSLRLTGVDVVPRPPALPGVVEWLVSPGGPGLPPELTHLRSALVVAHEWLDVVPCAVAQVDEHGVLRYRLVDPTGVESWGPRVTGRELEWSRSHWPGERPGERVEIGLSRDLAWSGLLQRLDTGLAVAIDYGHRRDHRPREGTLTAYRTGRQVTAVPDGSCDLTAHVAMDSLVHTELVDQRTALRRLGVLGQTPPIELAHAEPLAYLRGLERAGAAASLTARGGFGDFLWAFSRVG